jgi:hypothetical protein
MATYVPGYKRYERDFEPFQPDFKFLDNVLSIRQDRYNTNYKQMNDLYGKIVYAELSRDDTKEIRDQYTKQLIPKVQQASGMDLSIQANVDAAQSLFTPFYEDDLIVRDLVNTSSYKGAMRIANSYKDSDDDETRRKYWSTGIEALQYQMEDFITADRDAAVNMAPPRYVPNADLYNVANEYLKQQGYEMKWVTGVGGNSKFIITGENGERLIPTAYADLQNAMQNDPRIIDAYRTDAYVQSRRFAAQGMEAGKYSSIQEGRNAWAQNTIQELRDRAAKASPMLQKQYEDALASKESWEKYASNKGITLSDQEVESMQLANTEYEEALLAVKNNQTQLERLSATDENTDYVNLVSSLLMSYNISSDLYSAAKNYSISHGGVKSVTANPYTKMKIQHSYNKALARYKDQLERQRTIDENNAARQYLIDLGIETPSLTSTRVDENRLNNAIDADIEAVLAKHDALSQKKLQWLKQYQFETAEGLSNSKSFVSITNSNGEVVKGKVEEVYRKLKEAGDLKAIDTAYESATKDYEDLIGPDSKRPDFNPLVLGSGLADIRKESALLLKEKEVRGNVYKDLYKMILAGAGTDEDNTNQALGETFKQYKNQNVPKILRPDGTFKTKEEFIKDFEIANSQGLITDKKGVPLEQMAYNPKAKVTEESVRRANENITRMGGWLTVSADPKSSFYQGNFLPGGKGYVMAEKIYDTYKNGFNMALSGSLNSEVDIYPQYSADAYFRGVDPDEMTSSNLFIDRSYSSTWSASTMLDDPQTRNLYGNFIKQWNGTAPEFRISISSAVTEDEGLSDVNNKIATQVFENIISKSQSVLVDKAADGKVSQANQNFQYRLTYEQTKMVNGKEYAAYTIDGIPRDDLNSFIAGKEAESKSDNFIDLDNIDDYTKVSFLVPKESDMSPYKSDNYNFSWVDQEINLSEDGMFEYLDQSKFGGTLKVYEDNGTYMYGYTQAYRDKDGILNYRTVDFMPAIDLSTNEPITKANIDAWVANQMAILDYTAKQNYIE